METPVRRYSSALQGKWTNSRPSFRLLLSRSRICIPAAMTSGPMPSPGTTAMRCVMRARIINVRCDQPEQCQSAIPQGHRRRHERTVHHGDGDAHVYVGFAKSEPDGIDQSALTHTSEVSPPVEVR